jgi:maltose alpha-D-glucosyltransferase/alpha-amylase
VQPVELDLRGHAGSAPVEILHQTRFPPVRETPYFLSLGPFGFYWFRLDRPGAGDPQYGIEGTAI